MSIARGIRYTLHPDGSVSSRWQPTTTGSYVDPCPGCITTAADHDYGCPNDHYTSRGAQLLRSVTTRSEPVWTAETGWVDRPSVSESAEVQQPTTTGEQPQ